MKLTAKIMELENKLHVIPMHRYKEKWLDMQSEDTRERIYKSPFMWQLEQSRVAH